jgi:hypothetical protein
MLKQLQPSNCYSRFLYLNVISTPVLRNHTSPSKNSKAVSAFVGMPGTAVSSLLLHPYSHRQPEACLAMPRTS